jgi:hypothetical protein
MSVPPEVTALKPAIGNPAGKSLSEVEHAARHDAERAAIVAVAQAVPDIASSFTPRGTWSAVETYAMNDLVSHAGATWVAMSGVQVSDEPGVAGTWQPFQVGADLELLHVRYAGGWPPRPALAADVVVTWVKPDPAAPDPAVGGTGMGPNDLLLRAVE